MILSLLTALVTFLATPAYATTGCNAEGWGDGHFADVRGCNSSYPAIEYLKQQKIVEGYQDGTFRPDGLITRAELTKILMATRSTAQERADCVAKPGTIFRDVPEGEWFAPYVCVAKERGVVSGYPDGGFAPHAWINYAEAAKIAANSYGLAIEANNEWDTRWYAPYSSALLRKHAVPPTVASYDGALTRGEMAEMIYRLETGNSSMERFATIPDGDDVTVYASRPLEATEFRYRGSLFSAKEGVLTIRDIYAPLGSRSMHSMGISHVRPAEDQEGCNGMAGPDGPCRPSLSQLDILVGELDVPYTHALLGYNSVFEEEQKAVTVDGRQGVSIYEGVECEGDETTFVPMDAGRTLVIRRNVNCNQQPEGYLSAAEVDALFAEFLGTVDILAEPSAQAAQTMQVTVLRCEKGSFDGTGVPDPVVPEKKTVPKSASVADMTLRALIGDAGPHTENSETCRGMWSLRPEEYRGVTVAGGVATVKLARPFSEIFWNDDGAQSAAWAQHVITANLSQFPSVQSVRYVVQP